MNEETRILELNAAIADEFASFDHDYIETLAGYFEESLTTIAEVIECAGDSCVLLSWEGDREYRNVHFPEEIARFLEVGDTFMLTIAAIQEDWYVIHCAKPFAGPELEYDRRDPLNFDYPVATERLF